jgi:hypothetical protein
VTAFRNSHSATTPDAVVRDIICMPMPFPAFREGHADCLRDIRRLLRLDGDLEECALDSLENFCRFAFLLPASGSEDHAYSGGLVERRLNVCRQVLGKLASTGEAGDQRRLEVLLACLLRDAGTAAQVVLATEQPADAWSCESENLADWVARHDIPRFFVRWFEDAPPVGGDESVSIALRLQHRIIRYPLLELLGRDGVHRVFSMLSPQAAAAAPDDEELLRRAEHCCRTVGRPVDPKCLSLFLAELSKSISQMTASSTRRGREILAGPSDTLLALPHEHHDQCRGQVWRSACAKVAKRLGAPCSEAVSDRLLSAPNSPFVRTQECQLSCDSMGIRAGADRHMAAVRIPNRLLQVGGQHPPGRHSRSPRRGRQGAHCTKRGRG